MGSKLSGNRTHKPRAPGAGRKPQSIRLRVGTRVFVNEVHPDGVTIGEVMAVEIVKRGHIKLTTNTKSINIVM